MNPMERGTERRKIVLIVQHAQHEHPAAVQRALQTQGIQSHCMHPYRGDSYPPLSEIAGVISLGGPMGANDDDEHRWIRKEIALMKASAEAGLPTIGICLGGQILARALGGRVEKNSLVELGWFPVEVNASGKSDPIMGAAGRNPMVYQWHEDTFHLPMEATLLASSKTCTRQAYRVFEKTYGFQFHPEADHQLVNEWLAIEGVEDEVLAIQSAHGPTTIQDSATQRHQAVRGEKASLKITAAIASLFQRKQRDPIEPELRDRIAYWATRRRSVLVGFESPDRRIHHIEGRITALLRIPAGEFIVVQEPPGLLLWPVRLEDIREIRLLSRKSVNQN
jgi:GMP synthase (glutamine-hydrolysing)